MIVEILKNVIVVMKTQMKEKELLVKENAKKDTQVEDAGDRCFNSKFGCGKKWC